MSRDLIDTVMECQIHRVTFGASYPLPEGVISQCPVCQHNMISELRYELGKVRKQRDALVSAFEIKQVCDIVKTPSSQEQPKTSVRE